MKLVILRTDIKTKKKVKKIKPLLKNNPIISNWSVDIEDIDNVLRIETQNDANENEIITMIHNQGFYCESLPDY